jgi:hypothetical protein
MTGETLALDGRRTQETMYILERKGSRRRSYKDALDRELTVEA